MRQRVHLFIKGDVVGVGFRSWTLKQARNLGLTGWVRNLENRDVEAVVEGERGKLIDFVDICNQGPEISWVENVETEWTEAKGEFTEFMIR